jgi:hypothetical protein
VADLYTPPDYYSSAFEDAETTRDILNGFASPVDAQTLVLTPPNRAPQTGAGVTTPQTGSLATAPSQAQPKVSGPDMLPGVAAKPENLVASDAQTQPGGSNLLVPQTSGFGNTTSYSRVPISTAGTTSQPTTPQSQPTPLQSRWNSILQQAPQQNQAPGPDSTSNPLQRSPMPSLPAAAQPSVVPDALNMRTQQDQARLAQMQAQPSGGSQIQNKWLRTLARVGDVAGSAIAPNILQYVPQSTIGHRVQVGRQQGIVSSDQAQQQARAQIENTQQKTALDAAKAAGTAPIQVTPEMNAQNPSLIIGSMIRPQDLGKTENTQTQNQRFTDQDVQKAAAKGQKPVKDAKGNVTGFEDDTDSAIYQSRKVQDDLRGAQQTLAEAKAELARAGNDPTSPAYKLAFQKAKTAQQNASAASIRANAYALNANVGNLGVDNQGRPVNGISTNAAGPMGTRVAPQYAKAAGNLAKFQDVYSSVDNANAAIEAAKDSGDDFNSAQMAEALSDPKTTSQQWLAGKINTTLSPEQQNLVITTKALREQINAMRSSVGGGVSDSQINRLVDQLPSATTPSLAYAQKQLATVRGQLDRLQAGLPSVNNGPTVQQPGAPANPTAPGGVPPGIPKANSVLIRPGKGQAISRQTAQQYLQKAGGDPAKASQLAARDGWKF